MTNTVIVGAGHAGSQCAVSLRQAGFTGEIVLIDSEDAPFPYHKPPLSKKYLVEQEPRLMPLRAASAYEKANVQIVQKRVLSLDTDQRSLQLQDGQSLEFDYLVMATGARNRSLPIFNDVRNVFGLRTYEDAEKLRVAATQANNIVVLGGGFIGLELAASLQGTGKQVHVIEASDRVLSRVAAEPVSAAVQDALNSMGVQLSLDMMASDFDIHDHHVRTVYLGSDQEIPCDCLIVGIGAISETELAEQAGMTCENGIVVDEYLQSSTNNIFAIGDCANFPLWQTASQQRLESVQNAVDQAKHVAQIIAEDTKKPFRTVPWFWSDIGPLKLQIAGVYQGDTDTVLRRDGDKMALYHLSEGRVVCVETINNAKDHLFARKAIEQELKLDEQSILEGPEFMKSLLAS